MFGAADLAVAAAMMFAGSTVLSTVGFGIGVATAPVLLLVLDPQTVVITVNTASLVLFVLLILQTRAHLSVRDVMPMAIAGLLAKRETVVAGAEAANVSYPGFWDVVSQLSRSEE